MTNSLKGEVTFSAGEDEYTLVFTIDALIDLEERFGKSVSDLGEMLGENLRAKDMRTLFHAGLGEHHPDLDVKAAGRVMSILGFTEAATLVARAFGAAFGVQEADAGAASPPVKPPTKAAGTGAAVSISG